MIKRINPAKRMSDAVIYNKTIYYTSVPIIENGDIYKQMQSVLLDIDAMLAKCGSNKSKILDVTIFLVDHNNFADMNRAWDEWVDEENSPVRCTVKANLMNPEWKVEVKIIAAQS